MASHTTGDAPVVVTNLTKRFGEQLAVDHLDFAIAPGRITGFLGPNGAGKTTTLRMLVGLAEPDEGTARVFGRAYAEIDNPTTLIGTLIDASGMHPGRRCRDELAVHAAAGGIDDARIPDVLAEVGLTEAAGKRTAHLSLGMRQRLGLAIALLGEPQLLVLDEPANGLDPSGMHWLRELLRSRAERGTSVLVSSHVLSELALFAEDVVVVNHGRLVTHASIDELVASGVERVLVRTPDAGVLRPLLVEHGGVVEDADGDLLVSGIGAARIGELAAASGVVLHQLRTDAPSLEDVFLTLTNDGEALR